MSAALECWSSRTSTTEEDTVEQVLMRSQDRSEGLPEPSTAAKDPSTTAIQKRFQRLSRNVSEAINSFKNSFNLDSPRENPPPSKIDGDRKIAWGSVVRSLTQLYPGSQLPEKLVSNIRKHYDSMPLSYSQAGFDMKDVFVHIRLIEQACAEDQPAVVIQEISEDGVEGVVYKITFACNSSISWPAVSGALENGSMCCKKIQIFERKSSTLGILNVLVQCGQEKYFKSRIENVLKSASKKPKMSNRKLPFGLCGCQEENGRGRDFGEIEEEFGDQSYRNSVERSGEKIELSMPLSCSSIVVSVDEWQTVRTGGNEIGKWLLNSESVEFGDQIGSNSFKGVYKGKRVAIEKLKGCDKGNAYEFELRKDLLELMTCGHKNIVPFYGVCVDESHGLCVVSRFMEGGSVHDLMFKHKKIQIKDVMRIAIDVAEGIKFMNDHGVAYRDLNTQRILLDRQGNAYLGDMGIVTASKSIGEAMEYETDGYRWLAPEIIAADPESASETWMSNVYSFGMVVWEIVAGEAAYSAYSPVQAAVGIAACGLRPEIPKDCPQVLKTLMTKCWNNCPSKRPQFSEILSLLLRPNTTSTLNNSCLHYMLPRKRVVEGEVVDDTTTSSSTFKKTRLQGSTSESTVGNSVETSSNCVNSGSILAVGEVGDTEVPITMAMGDGNPPEIDEDLHSRQLAVYGRETMRRLFASNVLVSGMQGLGAEIAKNLVLAGVKSVTLHDEKEVELRDLSSNFNFSENDVGKNRALASVQKLQELNNAVPVSALTNKLTKEQLSNFQAVVFTDISLDKAIEFNDYCHSHQPPIAFIKAEVRGLFAGVFCDFGSEFTVVDVDGEEPHTGIIASISNDNPALVSCVDDERLEFQDGDLVVFSEVQGMPELNDGKPRKIINARPYSFSLEEDTTNYGVYQKGGIVTQVKPPKVLHFKPLREALSDPGDFLLTDFSKFDRPPLLHLAFQALDKFMCEVGRYPNPGSEEDAQKLISIANTMNDGLGDAKLEDVNPKLLRHFAFGSRTVLNPMAAMFGGIVGQEVLKACSGKFHPLYQFLYFDSVESLPTEPLEPSDFAPRNSRYDDQISVFGWKLQKKMEDAKIFVVGSGALGCEFLKNLALMGVSCSSQGKLTVTDDDVIEKSNLSRQFLFRDWNIGQAKSTVAASAASCINPQLHIEALQNRVGPETENVFDDTFWENLSVVINALDNVNARLYVDQRCLYFQKPLLESGTLGAKCNTQMVIPHLTENYGASRDPPEKQAPMCTVHSFPHNIDHCLTWARSEFEGLLEKTPAEVNAYLSNPGEYTSSMRNSGDAQARDTLERVLECLERERCKTFEDCIAWARLKFEDYFANRVKQLTYTFPEDAATSTGAPFWSAPKRFPRPLQFSSLDPSHLHYIMAASILRAETFGIPIPDWAKQQKLAEAVDKVIVPDFTPRKDAKIVTDEKATSLSSSSIDDGAVIDELISKLENSRRDLSPDFRMKPIQFEKDDDTNYHMDLIAALANMRARNYSIPEVDKLKAKFIAGRIIPAIATSTAMATGLVCLELYKVLDGAHKLEDYRNTFANLALPLFSMAEPVPPKVFKHQNMSWTVWDRWVLKGNPTLRELIQWLKNKGLNAYSISCGSCLLFNSMFPRHKERMDKKIVDLATEVAKLEIPPYRRHLDVVVACEDDDDNDIDIPLVSVYFR